MQGLRTSDISIRLAWNRGTIEEKSYRQDMLERFCRAGTAESLRRFRLLGILILGILLSVSPWANLEYGVILQGLDGQVSDL